VRHRPHHLTVTVSHCGPAYVDAEYPIQIDITNFDDRELEVTIDVLLQPVEAGDAGKPLFLVCLRLFNGSTVNLITFGENQSSGLIKGTQFGVMPPGANIVKTLYLLNRGPVGDRTIDISIQSRTVIPSPPSTITSVTPDSPTQSSLPHDTNETLQTLVIPTVHAFKIDHAVTYRRSLHQRIGVSDLRTFDCDHWDDGIGGEALITSTLRCLGPWSLRLENIKLERKVFFFDCIPVRDIS
jgi:trafficking protein particle complex subunit 11